VAKVTLWRDEWEDGLLPDVCCVCGEKACGSRRMEFDWIHPALHLTIVAGLIPYLIIVYSSLFRWRAVVPMPVCETHRSYGSNRDALIAAGWFVLVLCLAAPIVGALLVGSDRNGGVLFYSVAIGCPAALVMLFVTLVVKARSVHATRIDHDEAELTRVSKEFAVELTNLRERLDADREGRRRKRPPRARRADVPRSAT
jgi:hypothetical protein